MNLVILAAPGNYLKSSLWLQRKKPTSIRVTKGQNPAWWFPISYIFGRPTKFMSKIKKSDREILNWIVKPHSYTLTEVKSTLHFPPSGPVVPTFLSWVDGGDGAEGTLSHVVVDPDLDLVGGKRRDALVLEDVSGGVWRRDGGLHPTRSPKWAEGDHVAKARAALQLLRHRLKKGGGGGVCDSEWMTQHDRSYRY